LLAIGEADAHDLMMQAVESLRPMADQAGVEVIVEPADAMLRVDADRIVQTITNLVGNAIKFSPRGTRVTVDGFVCGSMFVFRVADEGRGIPPDKLEMIFERFKQVDASDSRQKGGTGLGLSICRSIVTAHGGRIWAERAAVGSVFQFAIPIAEEE